MYTAVYLMCNMFRIYLIKHLTDMFFQGENPDKKHVVGVCIVFYAVNSALFICLNISLINLICNVLGIGALVCVYSRNRKYVIFIIVILTIVCMGCDMLATSLLTPAYKSGDALDMLTFVMVDMIMFVFMCLLRRIMQSRGSDNCADYQYMYTFVYGLHEALYIRRLYSSRIGTFMYKFLGAVFV